MSGAYLRTRPRSPTTSADSFVLTLWTGDPGAAGRADRAGVQRIGVDLERLGKRERQRGLGTWISSHREDDLAAIGAQLVQADLFARVDPLNPDTARQVEAVLGHGVAVLMLPMVRNADDAREFVRMVAGAALVVLLVEHRDAVECLPELVAIDGVDEIHIGLNDLALSLGLTNRWLTLSGELAIDAATVTRAAGKRFGLGAIGRAGDEDLPIPSGLIYAEYARTGATAALVSRSFFREGDVDLAAEVAGARRELDRWARCSDDELAAAHAELTVRAGRAEWF